MLVAFLVIVMRGTDTIGAGTTWSPLAMLSNGSPPGVGRSIDNDRLSVLLASRIFHDQTNELASDLRAGCKARRLS